MEINRYFLTFVVACLSCISAVAQQIEPRIVGLEANSRYMTLLTEDDFLSEREDSIAVVVESLRNIYRTDAVEASASREKIITLENQLFELRARKALVVDSLNMIEQEWVLNNMSAVERVEREETALLFDDDNANAKYIYESPNVKINLSSIDYKNLVKAEEEELRVERLSNSYTINYDNMLSLSRSYQVTFSQSEADNIIQRFDSLSVANVKLLEDINDTWGFIYDNKSFAYSLLMELLGFTDVLTQEAELMRKAQAEISSKQMSGGSDVQMRYLVQKSSMVEFEIIVAEQLALGGVVDSLKVLSSKLAGVSKVSLPPISIEERLFINYEPIKYVTKYASSSIPETVIYDRGVVFRIYVGSFSTKQPVTIFRNTMPLSHQLNEEGRHCYYIGGFETYDEAEAARAELKKHGFRSPQVVVWKDGRERNLTQEPLSPMPTATYRVDIDGAASLPQGANDAVSKIAPSSTVSKVGTDKYVINALQRQLQVDSLVNELRKLDPNLKIVVEKSIPEIVF
ncbi:MAG: SPOR domain-containing protein [Rikenellaceae bacterium]